MEEKTVADSQVTRYTEVPRQEEGKKFSIAGVLQEHRAVTAVTGSEIGKGVIKVKGKYARAREILGHMLSTMAGEQFTEDQRQIVIQLLKTIAIQEQLATSKFPDKADELLDIDMAIFNHILLLDDAPAFIGWLEKVFEKRGEVVYQVCQIKLVHLKKYVTVAQQTRHAIEKKVSDHKTFFEKIKHIFRLT